MYIYRLSQNCPSLCHVGLVVSIMALLTYIFAYNATNYREENAIKSDILLHICIRHLFVLDLLAYMFN